MQYVPHSPKKHMYTHKFLSYRFQHPNMQGVPPWLTLNPAETLPEVRHLLQRDLQNALTFAKSRGVPPPPVFSLPPIPKGPPSVSGESQ